MDDLASLLQQVQGGHEPSTVEVRSIPDIEPALVERAVLAAQADPNRDPAEIVADVTRQDTDAQSPRDLARDLPRFS